jgi:hypothetical protein
MKEETKEPKSYVDKCWYSYYFDENTKTGGASTSDWMGLCKANPFYSCVKFEMPVIGIVTDDNNIFNDLELALVGPNGGITFC